MRTPALRASIVAIALLAPFSTLEAQSTSAGPDWSHGLQFSGLIDGYYNYNANHPPESDNGNQLRNFDFNANSFSLSMAKLTIAHDPAPVAEVATSL